MTIKEKTAKTWEHDIDINVNIVIIVIIVHFVKTSIDIHSYFNCKRECNISNGNTKGSLLGFEEKKQQIWGANTPLYHSAEIHKLSYH